MTDWKRKLAAYLHDPPSKALNIRTHGDRSDVAFHRAGFVDTEIGDYFAHADHTGAAADRLPFPGSRASGLACAFDGVRNAFRHPLSGQPLPFHAEFKSAEQGIEGEESVQPLLSSESLDALSDDNLRWRARFFAHWRLWRKHASEKDYRLALLPADTRIPDHSIWTHMQVVSALDGCVGENKDFQPAFLKFQLGPVQDFIAAARSIRDLWSGSYLLSWLMAAGLKALSAEVGPDAVIFPNLRGQPLFDLHWRDELWSKVNISDQKSVWESLGWKNDALLTPNLPNVFLAVVSADRAADLGRKVGEAIQAEWKRIADAVWNECESVGLTDDEGGITAAVRKLRFDSQIARFLSVSWQVTPWPENLEAALNLADSFERPENAENEMPIQKARKHVQAVVDMAEKHMPKDQRDVRYFECETFPEGHSKAGWKDRSKLKDDAKLDNVGLGWSVILALNNWQLDAVRQTRSFDAANTGGWQTGTFNNKDVLTGREEAVAGGTVWTDRTAAMVGAWKSLFKHGDWLGAATLVKRVWHLAYLGKAPWNLATNSQSFPMPNTRSLAAHDPFGRDDDSDNEKAEESDSSEKHFAVLAFDGDEIGKWVSGEKTPPFASQLADYTDGSNIQRSGAKTYFEKPEFKGFLESQRPLSPSYHLQFSEALSNFALLCARPIVEAFDGRLIYAGGDDVVALLPADSALACGEALRMAFTGSEHLGGFLEKHATRLQAQNEKAKRGVAWSQAMAAKGRLLAVGTTTKGGAALSHPGFLVRLHDREKPVNERHFADGEGRPIPFLVPGPKADASVGIAIAHFKAPLQDVVRAAQIAEKRAKKQLGRSAIAVTLFKRSGETIEWGCKWAGGGLQLYRALAEALDAGQLSGKFPYRFTELLSPYLTESTPLVAAAGTAQTVSAFNAAEVIQQEFTHTLGRQRGPAFPTEREAREQLEDSLTAALGGYLSNLASKSSEEQLRAVIGLCQTVAFAHRTRSENQS